MSAIDCILVPLNGSALSAQSLGCALWLAERLDAKLHVLSAAQPELPAREALERLQVPEAYWPRITLHVVPEFPERAVLDAVERYGAQLIVMTARGWHGEEAPEGDGPLKVLGHVTRWVVERSPVPVLVLPPSYRERLPWTAALVPISGEAEADEALSVAVRLGNALGLHVTAAHVLGAGDEETGLVGQTRYADAAHHEYPSRLQELVSRGLPSCEPSEAECLTDVVLSRGDIDAELGKLMQERRIDLLVIGWHGRFLAGHANVVKSLLGRIDCPVLLVKAAPHARFRLKVGEELE